MHTYDKFFIGGEWVDPAGSDTLKVTSPSSGEIVGSVPVSTPADMDRAVAAAKEALTGEWSTWTQEQRADLIQRVADGIKARQEDFSGLITEEVGSPFYFSMFGQVLAAAMILEAFAAHTRTFAFEERRDGALGGQIIVRREPVGVAAGIIPWNVPLFITCLKLGPTLASGSTIVLKPAPETPLDANVLAEILVEAGVPAGVVNIVAADREVGEHLVRHPDVDKVSFTGSTAAGRKIGAICGEQLKRCTLELGGKSAAIVCEDADLEETIPHLIGGGLMNNGQACVALTRVLAPRSRYDEIRDALAAAVSAQVVGDPTNPDNLVGPLIADRQKVRVEGYITKGREEGATVVVGGDLPEGLGEGHFVAPTLFADVDNSMTIAREEIFGPVLSLIAYDTLDDAIAIANDSDYGLAGAVYTTDIAKGIDVARKVRTGTFAVNTTQGMDFNGPFGGFKNSGIGRELGPEGIHAFCEDKTISLPGGIDLPIGG
ncbi:aldehyde dehydrogenase [Rhabdothermincola salaria]|uniref:aldehyde dehydrogenase n=1 Tax=Rhabdothermincola salaria TaxID=2903142 RepID=UPI001E5FCC45|nr:aldehyde dehydrogenase [Rhabdothermincola salaria]MCD9625032.1 aldehyde dehydrogenase [Rhabdothermincola salaria]